jgi:thiol-disulfide isomerase/thioredoxin
MKILKIGAVWCSGCLVMRPRFCEVERELPSLVTEYHDADSEPELIMKYSITDYPCFIFLDKHEKEIHREYGEVSKKKLIKLINTYKDQ